MIWVFDKKIDNRIWIKIDNVTNAIKDEKNRRSDFDIENLLNIVKSNNENFFYRYRDINIKSKFIKQKFKNCVVEKTICVF